MTKLEKMLIAFLCATWLVSAVSDWTVSGGITVGRLIITQEDVGATCTLGDLRIDTGGDADELCYCSATNTWSCAALGSLVD